MKIAVFGAGGIGGYFGGRLAQGGADVHLIARGEHLHSLQSSGLRVESIHGDFQVDLPATDDPATIGPCDYVLFCVKSFDTVTAAEKLPPLLDQETGVISLQNGVGNEETLQKHVGAEHVLGGVAYIFSTIAEPGMIEHTGGPARIVFGEFERENGPRAKRFSEFGDRATMELELSSEIKSDIWEKLAFICAQAGMTAAVRLPIGSIRDVEDSWEMFRSMVEEVCAVADAAGIDLPESTVPSKLDFARELPYDSYSSLHYDLTNGKRMELEALCGEVVRRGKEENVPVPYCDAVYRILKPWKLENDAD